MGIRIFRVNRSCSVLIWHCPSYCSTAFWMLESPKPCKRESVFVVCLESTGMVWFSIIIINRS